MTINVLMLEATGTGGICHYTYNLCRELIEKQIAVHLATNRRNYELENRKNIPFPFYKVLDRERYLNPEGLPCDELYLEVIQLAKKIRPSIVHFQWPLCPKFDPYFLNHLRREISCKYVYTAHNLLPHNQTEKDCEIFGTLYQNIDAIIVHGNNLVTNFQKIFNFFPKRLISIPLGNYNFLVPKTFTDLKEARKLLGLPTDKIILLFFGYISDYKGLEYLLQSLPLVKQKSSDFCLVIAGACPDFSKYALLIEELGIKCQIKTFIGYQPFEKVPLFFQGADIVVLPYKETYQSAVVQVAYAFGKPVIATNVGALPEVIVEGKSGFLVPPCNSQALADKILYLIKDYKTCRDMGAYSKNLAHTHFSWKKVSEKTIQLYQELLKN
ncbi:MAG: hypothetical protein PWQ96_69 [Clostridia bacterium]|nr:hypothetical protein [Clostridia bacterium]